LSIFYWNARLARYAKTGQYEKIRQLFQQMQQEGIPPDSLTFVQVLNARANLQAHEEGRQVHKQVSQSGWESNVCVGSSLVDMYAKCGSMDGEYSTKCLHAMLSLGMSSSFSDMCSVGKGTRHWISFDKCNMKAYSQSLEPFWQCWVHV
jgi:pentatricopeptide repeat protein